MVCRQFATEPVCASSSTKKLYCYTEKQFIASSVLGQALPPFFLDAFSLYCFAFFHSLHLAGNTFPSFLVLGVHLSFFILVLHFGTKPPLSPSVLRVFPDYSFFCASRELSLSSRRPGVSISKSSGCAGCSCCQSDSDFSASSFHV